MATAVAAPGRSGVSVAEGVLHVLQGGAEAQVILWRRSDGGCVASPWPADVLSDRAGLAARRPPCSRSAGRWFR